MASTPEADVQGHLSPEARDSILDPKAKPSPSTVDRSPTSASIPGPRESSKIQREAQVNGESVVESSDRAQVAPPLPNEEFPTDETSPQEDDGWAPVWDHAAAAFYFYNRFTQAVQWENPRVPMTSVVDPKNTCEHAESSGPSSSEEPEQSPNAPITKLRQRYNPAIHGDYDPNADYAQVQPNECEMPASTCFQPIPLSQRRREEYSLDLYAATGTFNRFNGRFVSVASPHNVENYTDEAKSQRQMNAYFDVDAAANNHDGRSLKAERQGKKLSRKEVKAFRDKRRERKEERKRAWLRD